MTSVTAQSIGSPHFVTGKVIARNPEGIERIIKAGDKLFLSDTIITGASSAIHIDFDNGETVEVFSNQNFSLADYLQQNGFEFAGEVEAEQVEQVIAANEATPEQLPDPDDDLTIEDILNLPAPTAGQQSAGGGIEEPVILPFDIRQVTPDTRAVDTGIGGQAEEITDQSGGDGGASGPVNNAPTIEITANNLTENNAAAGDVVATYTTTDENPASLTVSWNGPVPSGPDGNPYYQLDTTNNRVLLTQAGADHVNAGRDLPPVNLTVTDDSNQTGQASGDPGVILVNDAPESSNDSITTDEDTPKVLGLDDFGNYSDEENSPLAAVKITGLPTDGSLEYQNSNGQWVNVTLNQEISAADISGGKLRFVPDPNENGNNYATLKFQVGDGARFSESDYTLTVDVTPVNDAPATNNASGSGDEDSTGIAVELSGGDIDGTVDGFVIKSLPANGTLKLADGTVLKAGDTVAATNGKAGVVFIPNKDWNGSTDFNFAAKDNNGQEDPTPAKATITVNPLNDAPTTNNASGSGDEDSTGIAVELSGGDIDGTVDGFVIKSLPANGTLKLADGTVLKAGDTVAATNGKAGVVFIPNKDWSGSTDFNFAAKDNNGQEDPTPAKATITVNPLNDAPTTNNASGSGDEDSTGIAVELSGGDIDGTVDGFVIKSLPANGTLKLADGTVLKAGDTVAATNGKAGVVFIPNKDWNGSTDFNFAAKDNNGQEDPTPAKATITVNPLNDAPTTNNASGSGDEDSTGIAVELSGGDIDGTVDGFVIKSLPANGTLKLADGTVLKAGDTVAATNGKAGVVFVPNKDWNGSTDFNFAAKDNNGLEDPTPATATVTVNSVNDAPTTNNASGSGDEDSTGITVELSGGDIDGTVDGFVIKSLPANGTLKLADGTVLKVGDTVAATNGKAGVVFVPNKDWNGSTDFNFAAKDNNGLEDPTPATATVTVNSVNDAPTTNNASGSGDEDSTGIAVELSGGDIDGTVDGFVIKSLPANGTLKLADGTVLKAGDTVAATNGKAGVVFVPNKDWNGSTDFNFAAKDNNGLEDPTPATATVTVNSVNDAPTTNNASGSGDEDSTGIAVELSGGDIDGTVDGFVIKSLPANGTLKLADGTVLKAGDTVAATNGKAGVVFVPNKDWNGSTDFNFAAKDNNGLEDPTPATATVTVNSVNDAPTTNNASGSGDEDSTGITVELSGGDIDGTVDGFVIKSLPANGTLKLADGTVLKAGDTVAATNGKAGVVFVPNKDWNGSTDFNFAAKDNNGLEDPTPATATVTVNSVNDAPTTNNASGSGDEDSTGITVELSGGDIDGTVDGFVIKSLPANGTLKLADGTVLKVGDTVAATNGKAGVVFVPNKDWNGSTDFNFAAKDNNGLEDPTPATATVTVNSVNDAPTTNNASGSGDEDSTGIAVELSGGDIDGTVDGFVIKSLPANGTLKLADGTVLKAGDTVAATNGKAGVVFIPNKDWNGSTDFNFAAKDNNGLEDPTPATATVTVNSVNDAPESSNDSITTLEDTPKVLGIGDFGNYSDIENSPLASVKITSLPTDGTLQYKNSSGQWVSVTQNQEISRADITGGKLRFVPDANENGNNYATLKFKVSDGTDFSDSDYSLKVNVTPVNDAPTSTDDSVTTAEDTPKVLGVGDFGNYSDVENSPLAAVKITSLPTDGTLQYKNSSGQWVSVTQNQEISRADITGGKLRFVPDLHENGNNYATLKFKVSDGTDFSDSDYSLKVNVTPVNDAPEANDDFFGVVLEDSTWNVNDTVGVIKNNDKEYDGDKLIVTHIRTGTENNPTNPVQGSVGKALVGKYGTLTLFPDGRFKYTADQDALDAEQGPLPVYDVFTYTVSDGNGKSDTAQITIAVQPRDDTSKYKPEVTLAEDTGIPTDDITANAGLKVVFNGDDNIAESNYTVEFSLFDSNTNTWSAWSKEYSPVAEGDNQSGVNKVKVRVIDPAGKVSQESDSLTFTYKESPRSGVIDVNNFDHTDKGFTLAAKGIVGFDHNGKGVLGTGEVERTNKDVDHGHPDGFGVKGGGYEGKNGSGGHSVETGYHHGVSEELIVNFDNQVQEAKVHFLWHGNGESAIIELWRDGKRILTTSSDKNGNNDGGEDDVDPIITLKLENGQTFDRIVFKAYGGPDDQNNDYLIKKIEFKEAPTPQTVTGDENDNILVGDPNGGILDGKGGDDQLIGGDGADTFVFDLADLVDNGTVQTDTIKDFTRHAENAAEADKLDLSDLVSVSGNLTHHQVVDALKTAGLSVEFRNGDTVLHFEDQSQGSNKEELDIVLVGHEAGDWNNQNDVLLELVSNGQILV